MAMPPDAPVPHRRWGGCADELLHYTSRYYPYTEAFLRNLTAQRDFVMAGYQAEKLEDQQRAAMLAMLMCPPLPPVGQDVMRLVWHSRNGNPDVPPGLTRRYARQLQCIGHQAVLLGSSTFFPHPLPEALPPLDPFLALAERLELPVAIHGDHVEVPFEQLVRHMDSPLPQVRDNLQQAVLWLHEAGYHLYNHPQLTHSEGDL